MNTNIPSKPLNKIPYEEEIIEFKNLINCLNKQENNDKILLNLKKLELNLNHIKRIYNYETILEEKKFFKTLKSLFFSGQDKEILNQIICILFELSLESKENSLDNKFNNLIVENGFVKYLINILKNQNINDNEFENEKLLIIIQLLLEYIVPIYFELSIAEYENLYDNLILNLKELDLFRKDSQKMLNFLLNSIIYLIKIKDNINLMTIFNFCDLIEYLKENIDFINCKNTDKLLSCIHFFIIAQPDCLNLFNEYDGYEFLETIKLDKTIDKIKKFKKNGSSKFKKKIMEEKKEKWEIKEFKQLQCQDNSYDFIKSFNEMYLKEELLRAIYDYGLKTPTDIQQNAINPLMHGHNCIINAHSATGKTVISIISILNQIDNTLNECQALFLASTRESANQISEVIMALGDCLKINCHACIGGTAISKDIYQLKLGVHIVSGTIGRVFDMIKRGFLKSNAIKFVVLKNPAQIIGKDNKEKIYEIIEKLNQKNMQIILLCESVRLNFLEFSKKFIKEPILIELVNKENFIEDIKEPATKIITESIEDIKESTTEIVTESIEDIRDFYIDVEENENKIDILLHLFSTVFATIEKAIIFNPQYTNERLKSFADKMKSKNCLNTTLLKNPSKEYSKIIKEEFKTSSNRFLISNCESAFDFEVPVVVNYRIPKKRYVENYIYRSDRGKLNKKGITINLVTRKDKPKIYKIEYYYKISIKEMPKNVIDLIRLN